MSVLKIDYVEFETKKLPQSRKFFSQAFGWAYTEYGPDYLGIDNAGLDGGISSTSEKIAPPLVVLKADDLEGAQKSVEVAGGVIVREIFSFPGGRRFHFTEPGGNEMAVWSEI